MADIFQPVIEKLVDLGFYNFFLPWLITTAIFYALLKKSKFLGESNVLNGAISLAIGFLIFGFPILSGFSFGLPMSAFFTQSTSIILFFVIAFLLASMFYPNLGEFLVKTFTRRTTLWVAVALGLTIWVTSGMVTMFWQTPAPSETEPAAPAPSTDLVLIVAGVIIFIVVLMIASSVVTGGG